MPENGSAAQTGDSGYNAIASCALPPSLEAIAVDLHSGTSPELSAGCQRPSSAGGQCGGRDNPGHDSPQIPDSPADLHQSAGDVLQEHALPPAERWPPQSERD